MCSNYSVAPAKIKAIMSTLEEELNIVQAFKELRKGKYKYIQGISTDIYMG